MHNIELLEELIEETEKQEAIYRLMGDNMGSAHWILERVKLRGILYGELLRNIR